MSVLPGACQKKHSMIRSFLLAENLSAQSLPDCVMVALLTLTQSVWVQILVRQP